MYQMVVRRGAKFLDDSPAVAPEWRERINVDTLDIDDAGYCILGQVFGSFEVGMRMLELSHERSIAYGFNGWYLDMTPLNIAWTEYLGS